MQNIGKLITDETLLVDKKSLDNENFDNEYNWWEDFFKELEKNQSQTKNIKIPKSLHEKIENRKRENRNSFLCIYAHMGEDGMTNGYKDTDSGDEQIGGDINWEELFINIKDYVSTLWLVGCNSHTFADKYIKKFKGGKLKTLLVTTDKKRWVELIRFFEKEYCMDAITFIDDILLDIFKENPDFAMNCKLYAQDENGNLKEKINEKIN
ncbi:MAG: hypothetical protein K6G44_15975 [Lentisphaeria bacterium]|nr:hypothetical protein [Lentisphaeria bacterium]